MTQAADARIPDYLEHILRAVERIQRHTAGMNEEAFMGSELVQDAVLRNIEILGEAANKVLNAAPEFASRHSHIPWQVMYTMRNRVAHGYDTVDLGVVWRTVLHDLPHLYEHVQAVRSTLQAP